MERKARIALFLGLVLGSAAWAQTEKVPEFYLRETNQHLGDDGNHSYTIQNILANGLHEADNRDRFVFRDSTWLTIRSLDGLELVERKLLKAETHRLTWGVKGEREFQKQVDFRTQQRSSTLLPKEFKYAKPGNPFWPCWIDFRGDGLYLTYHEQERLLRPVNEFEHLFPEYWFFADREVPVLEIIEGYEGNEDWYYLNFAPGCMGNEDGICRQVIVPIPLKLLLEAKAEFLDEEQTKQ